MSEYSDEPSGPMMECEDIARHDTFLMRERQKKADALADKTPTVTAFHQAAEWTGVMSDNREAWLDMRHTMLTASDVASILGFGRGSAFSVYVDKITPRAPQRKHGIDSPLFWGNELEQTILTAVARESGWTYRKGGALLKSRAYPWLGATLDAEVDRHDGLGWVDLEGKTSQMTKEWSESEQDLPTSVLIQVQSQMVVTASPVGITFALLMGARPCQIDLEPSSELHSLIITESQRFMEQVRTLTPPPVDGTEATREALTRLYPLDNGSVVRLPEEAMDWSRELAEIRQQLKDMEARSDEIKNLLRRSIGSATFGVLPDEVDGKQFWRWQRQDRKEHIVKASSSRVLLQMKNGPDITDRLLPESSPLELSELPMAAIASMAPALSQIDAPIRRARRRSSR